jgi:hypothetical protein
MPVSDYFVMKTSELILFIPIFYLNRNQNWGEHMSGRICFPVRIPWGAVVAWLVPVWISCSTTKRSGSKSGVCVNSNLISRKKARLFIPSFIREDPPVDPIIEGV